MKVSRTISPWAVDVLAVLGRQISTERRQQRWTQAELAERAGVSIPTVQAVESGAPGTGIGIVFEIAHLLGIPLIAASDDDTRPVVDTRFALLPKRVDPPKDDDDDF